VTEDTPTERPLVAESGAPVSLAKLENMVQYIFHELTISYTEEPEVGLCRQGVIPRELPVDLILQASASDRTPFVCLELGWHPP
jgi:hypothetical protein